MVKKITKIAGRSRLGMSILVTAMALGWALPPAAHAIPLGSISQIYVFGDSLSDSGWNNLWATVAFPPTVPTLPTDKAPTFTTFGGYTWAQYVIRDIKGAILPVPGPSPIDTITNNSIYPVPGFNNAADMGVNYACGGSTTNAGGFGVVWAPSLHEQVAYFLATSPQQLDPNALYFIWSGANDILSLLALPTPPTQAQLLVAADTATTNIVSEVANLRARGANRIVVLSLPNIASTPLINMQNNPATSASVKNLSFTFDTMLNVKLGKIIATTGVKVLYFDTYSLIDEVVEKTKAGLPMVVNGQSFQFVNATQPACGAVTSAIYCPNGTPNNYVFADTIHPTDLTHRVLSVAMEAAIQKWA